MFKVAEGVHGGALNFFFMEVPHVSSIPEFQGLGDLGIGEKRSIPKRIRPLELNVIICKPFGDIGWWRLACDMKELKCNI